MGELWVRDMIKGKFQVWVGIKLGLVLSSGLRLAIENKVRIKFKVRVKIRVRFLLGLKLQL